MSSCVEQKPTEDSGQKNNIEYTHFLSILVMHFSWTIFSLSMKCYVENFTLAAVTSIILYLLGTNVDFRKGHVWSFYFRNIWVNLFQHSPYKIKYLKSEHFTDSVNVSLTQMHFFRISSYQLYLDGSKKST